MGRPHGTAANCGLGIWKGVDTVTVSGSFSFSATNASDGYNYSWSGGGSQAFTRWNGIGTQGATEFSSYVGANCCPTSVGIGLGSALGGFGSAGASTTNPTITPSSDSGVVSAGIEIAIDLVGGTGYVTGSLGGSSDVMCLFGNPLILARCPVDFIYAISVASSFGSTCFDGYTTPCAGTIIAASSLSKGMILGQTFTGNYSAPGPNGVRPGWTISGSGTLSIAFA